MEDTRTGSKPQTTGAKIFETSEENMQRIIPPRGVVKRRVYSCIVSKFLYVLMQIILQYPAYLFLVGGFREIGKNLPNNHW
jgi:hypothetical protein